MNRIQKQNLLNRVLHGNKPGEARKQLEQAMESNGRCVVIIDDLDSMDTNSEALADSDTITFHDQGKDHRMKLGEVHQYARRHFIQKLYVFPVKKELIQS